MSSKQSLKRAMVPLDSMKDEVVQPGLNARSILDMKQSESRATSGANTSSLFKILRAMNKATRSSKSIFLLALTAMAFHFYRSSVFRDRARRLELVDINQAQFVSTDLTDLENRLSDYFFDRKVEEKWETIRMNNQTWVLHYRRTKQDPFDEEPETVSVAESVDEKHCSSINRYASNHWDNGNNKACTQDGIEGTMSELHYNDHHKQSSAATLNSTPASVPASAPTPKTKPDTQLSTKPAEKSTTERTPKPQLLLVHGYGTTGTLAWRNVMLPLSHEFDVFAVDIPGFGRSAAPYDIFAPAVGGLEILNKYCDFFENFHDLAGLNKPYVVAHSFGGFLYTHCISRNETLASKLLLSDVPGIMSTNSEYDFIWATFFNIGLPQALFRPFGEMGYRVLATVLHAIGHRVDETLLKYWHELQTSPHLKSEVILSKFVKHSVHYAIATELALVPLLNISIPLATLTGTEDTISPPHHGDFLQEVAGIRHYRIAGTGHVPYLLNNGRDFMEVVKRAFLEAQPPSAHASHIASCLQRAVAAAASATSLRSSPVISSSFSHTAATTASTAATITADGTADATADAAASARSPPSPPVSPPLWSYGRRRPTDLFVSGLTAAHVHEAIRSAIRACDLIME